MKPPSDDDAPSDPLIVTLRLDKESSRFFDRQRERFFPPERNFLAAHVTLFHKLPGERMREVERVLADEAARQEAFPVDVAGLRFLGRGVAYDLQAADLLSLRGRLAEAFEAVLTPQDRQGFRPHVTVQNKVEPAAARSLMGELQAGFAPWEARAEGLELHRYEGGPWELLGFYPFEGGGKQEHKTKAARQP